MFLYKASFPMSQTDETNCMIGGYALGRRYILAFWQH
jgi:hypothetical protein